MENTFENYSCADGSGLSRNSVTSDYWDSSSGATRSAALATAVLMLCFIIVGLPNNLLVVASILRQRLHGEPTYILLLNLALVDLLLCIFVLPLPVVSGFAGGFVFGGNDRVRCRICQLGIILTILGQLNIHILALLSLDRLIFIKYALKYHRVVTARRVIITMICVWMSSIFISTFPLFGFGDLRYERSYSACSIIFSGKTKLTKNIYYVVFLAVEVIFSLFVLFAANFWVGFIVQKHIRKIYSIKKTISGRDDEFVIEIKERMTQTKNLRHLQFVRVIGSIFVANIVTWIPFLVYVIYYTIRAPSVILDVTVYVSIASAVVIHPVIQVAICPELRRDFVAFYGMCFCCYNVKPWKYVCCFEKCKEKLNCDQCLCFIFSSSFLPDVDECSTESLE